MSEFQPITESNNFIILDKYTKIDQPGAGYQTEADLERELIQDLVNQGYEHLPSLTTPEKCLLMFACNCKILIMYNFQKLNGLDFVSNF